MCAVSAIGDQWTGNPPPNILPYIVPTYIGPSVSRQEFEVLKKEVEALKKELEKAKQEDIDNGEPDCEMEEKIAIFRRLGELFGVDFDEVFKPNAS